MKNIYSFTAPTVSVQPAAGQNSTIAAKSFSLTNPQTFFNSIKNGAQDFQLESFANNLGEIGKSIQNIQQFLNAKTEVDLSSVNQAVQSIANTVKVIMPMETDFQIMSQLQPSLTTQQVSSHWSGFNEHPNNSLVETSLFTYLVQNGHKINLEKALGSGGSMIAAGKKALEYAKLFESEESIISLGSEIISGGSEALGTLGTIASETLGIESGVLAGSLGVEGALGAVGIGALEAGSIAAGGLVAVAGLAALAAGYGIYKAVGGEKSLSGIWSEAQNYFGGLFTP